MLSISWIKRLRLRFSSFRRRGAARSARLPRQLSSRLSFERLEDRTLLATITVNSVSNDWNPNSELSLAEAILIVNDGNPADGVNFLGTLTAAELAQIDTTNPFGTQDTIAVSSSLSGQTISLGGSPLPTILKDVNILGSSEFLTPPTNPEIWKLSPRITIDGQNLSNIFRISGATTDVGLFFLNVINGRETGSVGGAAVQPGTTDTGVLSIAFSTFSGNSIVAPSDGSGGAIHHRGPVVAQFSTFTGNSTYAGFGGAIYAQDSPIQSIASTFSGNSANIGGALATTTGDIHVFGSTISGNSAGGGITSSAGGIFTFSGDIVVSTSTVTGNMAPVAGGIGPFANNSGESLTIQGSIVAGNTANVTPDFYAPGGGPANLTVTNSLIGRSDNTSLTPTFGSTPDGNGNFIGGTQTSSAINPLLGPLQDNGGLTRTHALLPGSLAIDAGGNSTPGASSGSDQRGPPFVRVFNGTSDMGAFEFQPLTITGNTAFLNGTPGRDSIVYRVATKLAKVNDATYVLPSNINLVQIDGLGNKDTLNLIGTANAESAITGSGMLQFEHDPTHSGFDITGANLEVIILDGQGGNDIVTFNDTAGDDKFFARPMSGFMIDTGGQFEADAFGYQMTGAFTTGNDLAKFFDAPGGGNETVTANPTTATLQGAGFLHTANNFDVLVASSRNGSDVVNAFGTNGNDAFTGRAGIAVFSSTGFNYQFDGFATVNVDGLGGTDLVRFLGGPGNDALTANPTSATFQTGGFTLSTTSFERLIGIAGSGANDTAILTDSAGNDIFAGTVSVGELAGTGFFERVINFDTVTIRGVNGGTNRRTLNNIGFQLIEQGTWV